ncbi:MAG: hypothetical protein J6586_01125 [Snodgrassella sp.]|uniref:hypothetical protein n=1 Tax=Snodgrassella TaxID=1193515 RepID=UPI00159F2103|nr:MULTISPECIES: hypothetical protein [Snodgrassella]MCO6515127.1 hypothetical protein [Snodgrassella sp.]MCO6519089.1 hypothetical protein [Snodgrassella sp.]
MFVLMMVLVSDIQQAGAGKELMVSCASMVVYWLADCWWCVFLEMNVDDKY